MKYYQDEEGNIYSEDDTFIVPDDNNVLWKDYVDYLKQGGTLYKDKNLTE